MKNTKRCPKCSGEDIGYVPGGLRPYQNSARVGALSTPLFRVARYVCKTCGFTEEWVDRPDDMEAAQKLDSI